MRTRRAATWAVLGLLSLACGGGDEHAAPAPRPAIDAAAPAPAPPEDAGAVDMPAAPAPEPPDAALEPSPPTVDAGLPPVEDGGLPAPVPPLDDAVPPLDAAVPPLDAAVPDVAEAAAPVPLEAGACAPPNPLPPLEAPLMLAFSECTTTRLPNVEEIADGAIAAVANFDADGFDDLVVASWGDNQAVSLLSNGDGSFQLRSAHTVGDGPRGIVTADLNEDGISDVVTSGMLSLDIAVMLGSSDGRLSEPQFQAGPRAYHSAAGDLNGDGHVDLVVGNTAGTGFIGLYLGNGDGTLSDVIYTEALDDPISPALGDFDRDGDLDIVVTADDVTQFDDGIAVLLNRGDASFEPAVGYVGRQNPFQNTVGDFTSDGYLDVLTVQSGTNITALFPGNCDGTFGDAIIGGIASGSGILTADFNLDGRLDAAFSSNNRVTIYPGSGDGTFAEPLSIPITVGGGTLTAPDLDGDAKPDLVVSGDGAGGDIVLCALLNLSEQAP